MHTSFQIIKGKGIKKIDLLSVKIVSGWIIDDVISISGKSYAFLDNWLKSNSSIGIIRLVSQGF